MKILLLTIITIVVYDASCISQCANQDFYFTRQSQIDSFPIVHPGCDSVLSLTISGPDIINLGSLSSLKYVTDNFRIADNPLLEDLQGLDNVEHGGSFLEIEYNVSLRSLNGLSSLKSVFGFVDIVYNPRLRSESVV